MSIIKANGSAAIEQVRALPRAGQPAAEVTAPRPSPLQAELAAAQAELETLRAEAAQHQIAIEKLTQGVETAYREGEAAGRDQGRREAEERQTERLAALGEGVERAVDLFATSLSSEAEQLAVKIGREALRSILGNVGGYSDLLTRIVQKQIQAVGADSILTVDVSTDDFPDPAQLAALSAAIGHPGLDLRAIEALTSGECVLGLRLGTLDAGISRQWDGLDALLSDHAAPQAAE